jgi:membrane protein required for colicin V production
VHTLDWILLLPPLVGLIRGAIRGLVGEVAGLAALLVGLITAYMLHRIGAKLLVHWAGMEPQHAGPLAYVLLFILSALAIVLLGKFMTSTLQKLSLDGPNRLLGAVFGWTKSVVLMSLFFWVLLGFNRKAQIFDPADLQEYPIAKLYATLGDWMTPSNLDSIEITLPEPL